MLDYFALGLLIFVGLFLFYGIIAIHDIPYEIAKSRHHPQQDAIHIAGWISLLTLHVIWPFLWIWATLYRPDRGWGFQIEAEDKTVIPKLILTTEQLQKKLIENQAKDYALIQSLTEKIADLKARVDNLSMQNKDTL